LIFIFFHDDSKSLIGGAPYALALHSNKCHSRPQANACKRKAVARKLYFMGWQDRSYSRTPSEGGGLHNFLFGSVSLGIWWGIHVRVHSSLLLLLVLRVLFESGRQGGVQNAVISSFLLFAIILMHEFGHCFAARAVGGQADEILMWPLGGLAYVRPPMRPWPSFVTTAGGPLVNVVLCIISALLLSVISRGQISLPLNPLLPFGAPLELNAESWFLMASSPLVQWMFWVYSASWALLIFNLLPIYPLDGGNILQSALWPKLGFYRSMELACKIGMGGAILMGLYALPSFNFLLLFLAYAGFMTCRTTLQNLPALADQAYEQNDRYQAYAPRPQKRQSRPKGRHDDDFSWRDLNPFERIARARRKKQFERLFEDEK
jgi:Zn-dependent protease